MDQKTFRNSRPKRRNTACQWCYFSAKIGAFWMRWNSYQQNSVGGYLLLRCEHLFGSFDPPDPLLTSLSPRAFRSHLQRKKIRAFSSNMEFVDRRLLLRLPVAQMGSGMRIYQERTANKWLLLMGNGLCIDYKASFTPTHSSPRWNQNQQSKQIRRRRCKKLSKLSCKWKLSLSCVK